MSLSTILNSPQKKISRSVIVNAWHNWLARPRSRKVAADIVAIFDAIALIIGGIVPAHIYSLSGPGVISGIWTAAQWALVVAVIVHLGMRKLNMYDVTRMHDFPMSPGKILLCMGIAFLAVLGIGLPFTVTEAHMWIWYAAWASTSLTLIIGNRIIANALLARMTAAGSFAKRVAVYGTGTIAARLDQYLRDKSLGITFAGVFDDRTGNDRSPVDGPDPAGNMENLIELGRAGKIDQIIISLPQSADQRTAQIASKLEQLPVSVHICTHIASDLVSDDTLRTVSHLGPVGLLDIKKKPLSDWSPLVKTIEDYALASIFLVASLPVLLLAALAIKLESNGPVLFRQRRRGLNMEVFEVLKFRTMSVSEDGDDVEQATRNDPRVTRVGKFLRRTSIDELPQLINVLKGQMSLVGPRPHALVHDEKYSELLSTYANRHQVKPGMTGLAQVNGYRGETRSPDQMKKRVEFDLEYIRNWSIGLDLRILVKTFLIVILNRNAY